MRCLSRVSSSSRLGDYSASVKVQLSRLRLDIRLSGSRLWIAHNFYSLAFSTLYGCVANYCYKERLSLFIIYNCHLGKEYERSADLSQFIRPSFTSWRRNGIRLGVVCLERIKTTTSDFRPHSRMERFAFSVAWSFSYNGIKIAAIGALVT